MISPDTTGRALEDIEVNVKLKLAGLWITLMFVYLYVDYIGLFKPGVIEGILVGKIWVLEITQVWALTALVMMTIPSLMVFLSLALPAKANRWTNLIVAILFVVVSIGNAVGEETWVYYHIYAVVVEVVLLALVIWFAWKWPRRTPSG